MIAAALVAAALAAAPPCSACEGRGTLPCGAHDAEFLELEKNVRFCTVAAACRTCHGVLEVDCAECAAGDARIAAARAEREKRLAELAPHYELIGHDFPVGRSAHFEISWSGGSVVIDRRRVSEHAVMHLYVDRLEALYEDFKSLVGATDEDFSTLFRVMAWDNQKDGLAASIQYTNQPHPQATGTKRMGGVGIYTVFLDPAHVDPDESASADLYRAIVHNVTHLLLANVWNGRWPGQLRGGWLDEGLAHYYEDKLHGRCTNFCYWEQDNLVSYKGGRWRAPVRKLAASRSRPSFAETTRKRTDELTLEEHALAWSYCEFLIARDPQAFGAICRAVKEGKELRDPLREHYGIDLLRFEDEWKEHVRRTYRGK